MTTPVPPAHAGRAAPGDTEKKTMTPAEKVYRDAAAKADSWAEKEEAAGHLDAASTLTALAAAAKEKADLLAAADSSKPPALRVGDPAYSGRPCVMCGETRGVLSHGGLLCACSNPSCIRYGNPVPTLRF